MTGHKQVIVYPAEYKDGELRTAVREVSGRGARDCGRGSKSMQITAAVARESSGAFSIETVELTDPRPDELLVKIVASGMCQTDQHGRDGYYNTPLPAVFGHEGAGVVLGRRQWRDQIQAGRSRGDVVSLVRHLRQLPAPDGVALPEELRPQNARHAPGRLDAHEPTRRTGLQRLLSAIIVRDPRDRQRALRREGCAMMRRSICWGRWPAADKPAPARCSTRCSRSRATHSPFSVSGPSGCRH